MKRFAFLILCLGTWGIPTSVQAEDNMTVNGVQYTTTSKNTVCAYLTVKAIGDVEVKEDIVIKGKEYKTTKIGKAYFGKNEYLQSVIIPNSVTLIQKHAFKGCNNLSKVIIPDTLCQVQDGAFEGCTAIAYISTHSRPFKPDYVLAYMDKNIPYYAVKDKIEPWVDPDELKEILEDIEYDVDQDIPVTKSKNRNTYAFVIGNEDYSAGEAGVVNVEYAANDAAIFAKYCEQTLGIPQTNIHCYQNVTLGKLRRIVRILKETANANKDRTNSQIIFYYAGHGVPDEATRDAYLLPTDVDGKYTEDCYSLAQLYKELDGLPVKKVYVFLDACFSGSQRGEGMLAAARGVALKPKTEVPKGNMIVFSAATGEETAYPYKDKGHGMFTYFLLNQLKRYHGNCTLGELSDYVQQKVRQKSISINQKSQTPTVSFSPNVASDWKEIKLK